tara:strand:- start:61630 stop:62016 length:387 start_codon:yes stop_codon:yes gene_type:complete
MEAILPRTASMADKTNALLANMTGLMLLSGCVGAPGGNVGMTPPPMATAYGKPQPLVGWDAKRLIARYGEPRLDIQDRTVRKLQFMTGRCVLDTYLYVTARGREPTVTHIDTRHSDGSDADPAKCGIR